jgi:hypothetical protein
MSTIKNIYEMKGNESFRYYDETFRLLRKENSQPWQQELYRKAMFMKSSTFGSCQLSVLLQVFCSKTSVGCDHFKCHTFFVLGADIL